MKRCFQCKTKKDYSLFYKNKSTKDGYSGLCKGCQSNNERLNNNKTREWIISLKNKCSICGEKRYWCLDFHHLNPDKKTMDISKYSISGTASFETKQNRILKELEGCIVVCANCHRDIHHKEKLNK